LPIYRGSDDLGTAHEHAIYQDPEAGPMSDVMARGSEIAPWRIHALSCSELSRAFRASSQRSAQ